jgi:hypothetical protein
MQLRDVMDTLKFTHLGHDGVWFEPMLIQRTQPRPFPASLQCLFLSECYEAVLPTLPL